MSRGLAWYRPVRLSHRLFACGVVAVGIITLVLGRESPLFAYHGSIGYALMLLVVLRLIVAVFGMFAARSGLPRHVAGRRSRGHAAPTYATAAMLVSVLGLGITGVMIYRGWAGVKQLHVLLAYTLVAASAVHVLAVGFRIVRHRATPPAMGRRGGHAVPDRGISSGQPR